MKKIILVILLLLTTGCWDAREIKDLGIANSFFFDYKNGKIIFMAEVINPKTQSTFTPSPAGEIPYLYIRGEGEEILDATNNSTLTLNKYLYSSDIKAIFLTEAFVREKGLSPILDFFSRYPELRQNEYMVVIKDEDPEALYKSTVSMSDFFGDFVEDSAKTQAYRLSKSTYTRALEVIKALYCNMEEPVLGVIQKMPVSKDEADRDNPTTEELVKDNTKVLYEGLAVFNGNKFKGFISGEDTLMYNFVEGKAKAINITADTVTFKVLNTKPKVDVKYSNKKVKINVQLSLSLMTVLDEEKHDFSNTKTIAKFEKKINKKISKEVKAFLDKAQNDIGVDFLNFASSLHMAHPKEWKKVQKDWNKYFKKADIKVSVKSALISEGKIRKSIKEEE